ncbi:MAG: helix-turn-helix transcriptional regulator [Defluviitaleaceae bacterium]|nr:helix-turn-helix transcriptional regulator [Defluviitaleaceae bacterium]
MNILHTFARNVRKYRLANGYSQEKLAEYAGLHRTYVSAVERCRRSIALENVKKIADALHVDVYQLFIDDHEEREQQK